MALFLSSFVNKIDKKGRVSVPSVYRAALAKQEFAGIVVYPSFVNCAIEACSMDRIEKLSQSIEELDPFSDEYNAFATTILAGSIQLPFDTEGRVILPENLIAETEINGICTFVGKGQTFEIWQPEKFEIYAENARKIARENRHSLNFRRGGEK